MSPLVITLIVVGAVLVLAVVGLFFLVASAARGAHKRLGAVLKGERVLLMAGNANFSGKSAGAVPIRGNGILALTRSRIVFVMWAPRITLELPLDHVTGASTATNFSGRSGPTLVVEFRNKAGTVEQCGWMMKDPAGWSMKIDEVKALPPGGEKS